MRKVSRTRILGAVGLAVPLMLSSWSGSSALAANAKLTQPTFKVTSKVPVGSTGTLGVAATGIQKVIVILRSQHPELPDSGVTASARVAVTTNEQASIVSALNLAGATHVISFHLINAIAATVSGQVAAQLAANPAVLAVVPDRTVKVNRSAVKAAPESASQSGVGANLAVGPGSQCSSTPTTDPEALGLTNTYFDNPSTPQVPASINGAGVVVANLAEGINPTATGFQRANNTSAVTVQDFTGDGQYAVSDGLEGFLDASSVVGQGLVSYDVHAWNPAITLPGPCIIKIRGMAPGASFMELKVFTGPDSDIIFTTSAFVSAIDYAVSHGVNIINESFGSFDVPSDSSGNAIDPMILADDAAVAAGVVITNSSGDAGAVAGLGSPEADPNIIEVGGTTEFQAYAQDHSGRHVDTSGYVDNNISAFSSAGASSQLRNVDVVAPGGPTFIVCSTNTAVYTDCANDGPPPGISTIAGLLYGTSVSAPLTAGEAALIIQAYRQTHGGHTPTPAVVKQIIISTATDLGIPANEQGAGLINSLKAVQAAQSYKDAYNSTTTIGNAVLASPTNFAVETAPNTRQNFTVQLSNIGTTAQTVYPYALRLDLQHPFINSFADNLTGASLDQKFVVPSGTQHLEVTAGFPGLLSAPEIRLYDPTGRFVNESDAFFGFASFFGRTEVANPVPGMWTAHILNEGSSGAIHLTMTSAKFVNNGPGQFTVTPTSVVIPAGGTASVTVSVVSPQQSGDSTLQLNLGGVSGNVVGVIPITIRTLIPIGATGGSFTGVLTGGNGFGSSQLVPYSFDVPAGKSALTVAVNIPDNQYLLFGALIDPTGNPVDVESNDEDTGGMQFFRVNPVAGRWRLQIINAGASGLATAVPISGSVSFVGAPVTSGGVPNNPATVLLHNHTYAATIRITNSGNSTKDFFVDPRLSSIDEYLLGGPIALPPTGSGEFFLPPFSSAVLGEATSVDQPITLDVVNNATLRPELFGTSNSAPGPFTAVVADSALEEPMGLWFATPAEIGPFAGPAPASSADVELGVLTNVLDESVTPSTGNFWQDNFFDGTDNYDANKLTLAPGQTANVTVQITPNAVVGSIVSGTLNVETWSDFAGGGDEVASIPYTYKVG